MRHSELVVVLGCDEGGVATTEHETIDQTGMGVALKHDPDSRGREREAQRVVTLRRAVGQEPGSRSAVRLRGEALQSVRLIQHLIVRGSADCAAQRSQFELSGDFRRRSARWPDSPARPMNPGLAGPFALDDPQQKRGYRDAPLERERPGDWMYGANRAMCVVPEQEREI